MVALRFYLALGFDLASSTDPWAALAGRNAAVVGFDLASLADLSAAAEGLMAVGGRIPVIWGFHLASSTDPWAAKEGVICASFCHHLAVDLGKGETVALVDCAVVVFEVPWPPAAAPSEVDLCAMWIRLMG